MNKITILLSIIFFAVGCSATNNSVQAPPQVKETTMNIFSSAFANNEAIPEKYSCKGENISPPLSISDVPAEALSLAFILHDPDAPMPGGFTHWVLYNIPPTTTEVPENSVPEGAVQGSNSSGHAAYTGPCPPSGTHHYHFQLYALDNILDLQPGATKQAVEEAMQGHILQQSDLIGTFAH
jgi:Raf kinase inhibitor-like YbhB/YbcL family protein